MNRQTLLLATLAVTLSNTGLAASRNYINIVGSSTVYPFATVVAERFGRGARFKTPKIESTGSGGGMKLFCAGVGIEHPDITNASRRIKKSEFERCQKNGVSAILEIKIGYDGIVIANSKKSGQFKLSRKDLFMALARDVPDADGRLTSNPCKTWRCVNPALPDSKIEVLGPPPTSGTRDAFAELALGGGARKIEDLEALRGAKGEAMVRPLMEKLGIPMSAFNNKGKRVFEQAAYTIREDGAYIEVGENDNLIVQKLEANTNALGIFGFSFLDQNTDRVQGALVDGVAPEFDAIASGKYPVSRPLFFYVKIAHVGKVPGIKEYLSAFTSDKAWGDEGYLTDKGLIPLPREERVRFADDARVARNLEM